MNPYYPTSRIPTEIFLIALWKILQGDSISLISSDLKISKESLGKLASDIRDQMRDYSFLYPPLLRGTVQVDTLKYGSDHPSYLEGGRRYPAKRPIVMGFMDAEKRVFMITIPDRKQKTRLEAISRHIEKGSKLITNDWRGFKNLYKFGYPGSQRFKVGDQRGLRSSGQEESLWHFWRFFEEYMGSRRGVRSDDFIPRLKECEYRWNYRSLGIRALFEEYVRVLLKHPLGIRSKRTK